VPALEANFRSQVAVLWAWNGSYDAYGQPVPSSPPVEIAVRWNTMPTRREVLDSKGNTVALDATVVVNQVIAVGSLMWLGALAQWYGIGTGSAGVSVEGQQGAGNELMVVKTYTEVPDIKGRQSFKTVGLMRFRGSTAL
jgi:hypothetical protein